MPQIKMLPKYEKFFRDAEKLLSEHGITIQAFPSDVKEPCVSKITIKHSKQTTKTLCTGDKK